MIQIPITNIPNQSLSINFENVLYDITINASKDGSLAFFTISINTVLIVSGVRALPDFPIIPYAYLENGNFILTTMNDEYPSFDQFGVTQFLILASQSEIDAIRG
jgi:hypothetical protein